MSTTDYALVDGALDGFEDQLRESIAKLEKTSGRSVHDDMTIAGALTILHGTLRSVRVIRSARR